MQFHIPLLHAISLWNFSLSNMEIDMIVDSDECNCLNRFNSITNWSVTTTQTAVRPLLIIAATTPTYKNAPFLSSLPEFLQTSTSATSPTENPSLRSFSLSTGSVGQSSTREKAQSIIYAGDIVTESSRQKEIIRVMNNSASPSRVGQCWILWDSGSPT